MSRRVSVDAPAWRAFHEGGRAARARPRPGRPLPRGPRPACWREHGRADPAGPRPRADDRHHHDGAHVGPATARRDVVPQPGRASLPHGHAGEPRLVREPPRPSGSHVPPEGVRARRPARPRDPHPGADGAPRDLRPAAPGSGARGRPRGLGPGEPPGRGPNPRDRPGSRKRSDADGRADVRSGMERRPQAGQGHDAARERRLRGRVLVPVAVRGRAPARTRRS